MDGELFARIFFNNKIIIIYVLEHLFRFHLIKQGIMLLAYESFSTMIYHLAICEKRRIQLSISKEALTQNFSCLKKNLPSVSNKIPSFSKKSELMSFLKASVSCVNSPQANSSFFFVWIILCSWIVFNKKSAFSNHISFSFLLCLFQLIAWLTDVDLQKISWVVGAMWK